MAMDFLWPPRSYQVSRFARETPSTPRASQSSRLKDKGKKAENLIHPPNADQPIAFVNSSNDGYLVQAKYSRNHEFVDQRRKILGSEDGLIKYKANFFNVGVLGWGRCFEKWIYKQSKLWVSEAEIEFSPDVGILSSLMNKEQGRNVKDTQWRIQDVVPKSARGKEKDRKTERSKKDRPYIREGIDLKLTKGKHNAFKLSNQDVQSQKCSEQIDLDSSTQHCSCEQESIVLILPKDLSRPCSSEGSRTESLHGKLAHSDLGSFSDLSSFDESHTDESENDLVKKLDNLMKARGVEFSDRPYDMSPPRSNGPYRAISQSSVETDNESPGHQWVGFGLAKMTESSSYKEGSINSSLSFLLSSESFESHKTNKLAKARSSSLKRFLDPLLKSKVEKHVKEHSDDLTAKQPIPVVGQTVKAVLHLTVKNGLPLFKFVVETNNEVLASTAKTMSSLGTDDDIILVYTFYSVHKLGNKSGGLKNQKVKPCEFDYNVVGQMKVSEPHLPSWDDQKTTERHTIEEYVLYSPDVNKLDAVNSDFESGRELAAIVISMLPGGDHTVVILPGGDHSLPHEGVASSLITRWRTGGLCDCGGWDEGCKLRVLADLKDDSKSRMHSRSRLMDIRCGLYVQGESKPRKPFFRLVPFQDGIFTVEFDANMSSLQAFSTCVAVINSKQPSLCYLGGRRL